MLQVVPDGFVALRAAVAEHARNRLVQLGPRALGDAGVDRIANQRVMKPEPVFARQRCALGVHEPAARKRDQSRTDGGSLILG